MVNKSSYHSVIPTPKIRMYQSCQILKIYFGDNDKFIKKLPISYKNKFSKNLPPKFKFVRLPFWARDCGLKGKIFVPNEFYDKWDKVPWFDVVWWMATGYPEKLSVLMVTSPYKWWSVRRHIFIEVFRLQVAVSTAKHV